MIRSLASNSSRSILQQSLKQSQRSLYQQGFHFQQGKFAPMYYVQQRPFSASSDQNNKEVKPVDEKPKSFGEKVSSTMVSVGKSVKHMIDNPKETWQHIKEEAHHYWVGTKLLWSETKLTGKIMFRMIQGHEISRRERIQIVRTASDFLRLGPFIIIVIIPFMEFALPLLLKIFPNMLPSTYEYKSAKEAKLKAELSARLELVKFFQDAMQEKARKKAQNHAEGGATEILEFIEKARLGEPIPNDKVLTIAKLFKDELTLPNLGRNQLVSMCKYMNLTEYGTDDFLRFQLRNKIRSLKEDDRRILWEGVDSLNTIELRDACRERGMRSIGLTQFQLKHQLSEWLELSTQKGIPIFILIMSRAYMLTSATDEPEQILKASMSSLDSDVINEVVVASAAKSDEKSTEVLKRRLESVKFQEEMIQKEHERKDHELKTPEATKEPATKEPATPVEPKQP